MQVAELETYIVATPPPHIGGMYWLFVSKSRSKNG